MNKNSGKVILYLMRHGETILNRANRTQGWCDGVLTDSGIETAVNAGIGLSSIKFKAVYSSDLKRAIETAKIIIKENKSGSGLKLKELKSLREVYFGKYEGELEEVLFNDILNYLNVKSFKEAEEKYDFQKEYCNACASLDETNKAEDYNTVITRVMKSLKKICMENSDSDAENVLVVAHGGIIRLIIDYLDKNFNVRNMDNSSISKIIYQNGKFKVESVNDNSYSTAGKAISYLSKNMLLNIDMIEAIRRGTLDILYAGKDGVLIKEQTSGAYMISVDNIEKGMKLMNDVKDCRLFVAHQKFMADYMSDKFGLSEESECVQAAYMNKEKLHVNDELEIRKLSEDQIEVILAHYDKLSKDELQEILKEGNLFGGYKDGKLAGFIGNHLEGSIGLLEIFPEYRRMGYGTTLEIFMINRALEKGLIPFGQIISDNEKSISLQNKLGLEISKDKLYWMS